MKHEQLSNLRRSGKSLSINLNEKRLLEKGFEVGDEVIVNLTKPNLDAELTQATSTISRMLKKRNKDIMIIKKTKEKR